MLAPEYNHFIGRAHGIQGAICCNPNATAALSNKLRPGLYGNGRTDFFYVGGQPVGHIQGTPGHILRGFGITPVRIDKIFGIAGVVAVAIEILIMVNQRIGRHVIAGYNIVGKAYQCRVQVTYIKTIVGTVA